MVLAYGHADYAASLQDIGTPLRLEAGQGVFAVVKTVSVGPAGMAAAAS